MNMNLCMKNGRTIFFFELKTLIHELNFVKNNFHPESIKHDNAAVAMGRFFYEANIVNNSVNLQKEIFKGIEYLLNCALTLLLFLFFCNLGIFALHKTRSLKWQKMSNCKNMLSRKVFEQVHVELSALKKFVVAMHKCESSRQICRLD